MKKKTKENLKKVFVILLIGIIVFCVASVKTYTKKIYDRCKEVCGEYDSFFNDTCYCVVDGKYIKPQYERFD